MFAIHVPHIIGWFKWAVPFVIGLGGLDPLSTIMTLMNSLGSYFNTAQQQQAQQQVYGQQQNALSFIQNPSQMNQFMSALQSPYSFGNTATPGTANQLSSYLGGLQQPLSSAMNPQTAGQAQGYLSQFQNPLSSVMNPQTAGQTSGYLQGLSTPYSQALGAQNPNEMNSLISQYTQGLNSNLTSGVWNSTQDALAGAGLSQAPGVATYDYAQALAPYYQQNQQTAAGLAQAPVQYGLAEQQQALNAAQLPMNYQLAQQQYGLNAGQLPINYQLAQQQYGLNAGQLPLSYGLQGAQLGIGEATNALNYPLNIGSGLASMFPNYNFAAGGIT